MGIQSYLPGSFYLFIFFLGSSKTVYIRQRSPLRGHGLGKATPREAGWRWHWRLALEGLLSGGMETRIERLAQGQMESSAALEKIMEANDLV